MLFGNSSRHIQLPDLPRMEFEFIGGIENPAASSAARSQAEYWLPRRKSVAQVRCVMNSQICGIGIRATAAFILLPALAILAPPARGQVNSVVRVLSTPNPVAMGQNVTFTAGVNWTFGGPPSGSIMLMDTVMCPGASAATVAVLGAVTLGSPTSTTPGAGTLVVSSFPCAGDNSIVGSYSGDSRYLPGTSSPLVETVLAQAASTNTTLALSPNPSIAAQSVTLSAAINYLPANTSNPTGTVTFADMTTGSALGTVSVQTSGTRLGVGTAASITVTSFTAGTHAIQASYSGDGIYGPSASPIVNLLVTPAGGGTAGAPAIVQVVNAASYQAGIEAGSWVMIQGSNLANIADPGRGWRPNEIVNGQLPTSLDGVGVTIDGRPAFVGFISQHQINVQAPDDMAQGPVAVVVTNNGSASAPATAQLQPYAPGLFQWGATNYATATRYADGALVASPSAVPGSVSAKPGDTLILWGTGFGPTQPATPSGQLITAASPAASMPAVTVGGVSVSVIGATITPGTVSVYQIEIQLPQSIGLGDQPVVASIGGAQSAVGVNLFVANQ
jgi:uncharacterized protein (TIGR03437 family)